MLDSSNTVFVTWGVMAVVIAFAAFVRKNLRKDSPGKAQQIVEAMMSWLGEETQAIIGRPPEDRAGPPGGPRKWRAAQLYMATDEAMLCALARPSPGNRRDPLTSAVELAGVDRVAKARSGSTGSAWALADRDGPAAQGEPADSAALGIREGPAPRGEPGGHGPPAGHGGPGGDGAAGVDKGLIYAGGQTNRAAHQRHPHPVQHGAPA